MKDSVIKKDDLMEEGKSLIHNKVTLMENFKMVCPSKENLSTVHMINILDN